MFPGQFETKELTILRLSNPVEKNDYKFVKNPFTNTNIKYDTRESSIKYKSQVAGEMA